MDKKFVVGVIFITFLVLLGATFLATKAGVNIAKNPKAQVRVAQTYVDLGDITINGGVVTKEFVIENQGSQVLKLFNIRTSCMCTTAQLKNDIGQSPVFGMHSRSSYIFEVNPGKQVTLEVTFDPAYHGPTQVGPVTRQVFVETNDPDNPKLAFMFTANVKR